MLTMRYYASGMVFKPLGYSDFHSRVICGYELLLENGILFTDVLNIM